MALALPVVGAEGEILKFSSLSWPSQTIGTERYVHPETVKAIVESVTGITRAIISCSQKSPYLPFVLLLG